MGGGEAMILSAKCELDLLTLLSEGVFEASPWQRFLEQVRLLTRSHYVSLIFRQADRPRNSFVELSSGERWPVQLQRLYQEEMHKVDLIPYYDFQEGHVYTFDEMLSMNNTKTEASYRDLVMQSTMPYGRILRICEYSGVSAWLSISRKKDFIGSDADILQEIAPYVRTGLRTFVAIEHERFRTRIANDTIQSLGFGWMVLDAQRHILDADQLAVRALQRSQELWRSPGGRLMARSQGVERALVDAAKSFAENVNAKSRAIKLRYESGMELLLMPVDGRTIFSKTAPVMIVYVRCEEASLADRTEQLVELFGLLPSEARLALKLSEGLSVKEAAGKLGISVETARSYSKRIYEKTGTRGQSTLVRSILTSVISLV
jgi:DNA-binding CsgD family transcriptional regulator